MSTFGQPLVSSYYFKKPQYQLHIESPHNKAVAEPATKNGPKGTVWPNFFLPKANSANAMADPIMNEAIVQIITPGQPRSSPNAGASLTSPKPNPLPRV